MNQSAITMVLEFKAFINISDDKSQINANDFTLSYVWDDVMILSNDT